jgi:hypothetical protein
MKVRLKKIILNKQSTKKMCSSQKLCKNKECKELYKKSFASHEKSKYWRCEVNGKWITTYNLEEI